MWTVRRDPAALLGVMQSWRCLHASCALTRRPVAMGVPHALRIGCDGHPEFEIRLADFNDVSRTRLSARYPERGSGSGRLHSQIATASMMAAAMAAIHQRGLNTNRPAVLPSMVIVAKYLARRLTAPSRSQSCSIGPKRRLLRIQPCRRWDPRAAANAASRMNGVVGTTGRTMPMTPSTSDIAASPSQSARPRRLLASLGEASVKYGTCDVLSGRRRTIA